MKRITTFLTCSCTFGSVQISKLADVLNKDDQHAEHQHALLLWAKYSGVNTIHAALLSCGLLACCFKHVQSETDAFSVLILMLKLISNLIPFISQKPPSSCRFLKSLCLTGLSRAELSQNHHGHFQLTRYHSLFDGSFGSYSVKMFYIG